MKILQKIGFLILLCMIGMPFVSASSLSAYSSRTNVSVGSSVSVTVKATDAAGKVKVSSSDTSILSGGGTVWVENGSASVSFTAKKKGTATIRVSAVDVASLSSAKALNYNKSITIKVGNSSFNNNINNTPKEDDKPKSSINTLDFLSISGYSISPKFDSNTSEYKIELDSAIEKVKINAKATDSNATISGTGNRNLEEGMNTLNIVVRAENGSKRTYTIKANVKEQNPIKVNIDNKEYTVVKKEKDLPKVSDYYQVKKIMIDKQEVAAYYSDITKYTLVALKDSEGNIQLYIYDEKNNQYTLYREIEFSKIAIYIKENQPFEVPSDFKKATLILNENTFHVYQYKNSNYYLFYGLNIENGNEGLYLYDKKEDTIQRYFDLESKELYRSTQKLYKICIILGGAFIALFLSTMIVLIRKGKKV